MSRIIDADEMAVDESEAYIYAQAKITDKAKLAVNCVVHRKIQQLIADAPTVDPVHATGACYCQECRFYNPGDDEYRPFCFKPHGIAGYLPTTPDSFCSFGVKKEEYHEV